MPRPRYFVLALRYLHRVPSREDLELAAPLCYRRVVEYRGQGGVHYTCFGPMKFDAAAWLWTCTVCKGATPVDDVVNRVIPIEAR